MRSGWLRSAIAARQASLRPIDPPRPGVAATLPAWAACAGLATLGFALLALTPVAGLVQWFRFPRPGLTANWALLNNALGILGYLVLGGAVGAAIVAANRQSRWLRPALFVAVVGLLTRAAGGVASLIASTAYLHHVRGFPYLDTANVSYVLTALSGLTLATATVMALNSAWNDDRRHPFVPALVLATCGFTLEAVVRLCDLALANVPARATTWLWLPATLQAAALGLLGAALVAAWRASRSDALGRSVAVGLPAGAIGFWLLGVATVLGTLAYAAGTTGIPLTTLRFEVAATFVGSLLQAVAAAAALGALLGRLEGSPSELLIRPVVLPAAAVAAEQHAA
jgi:hypothetical protein